MVKMKIVLGSTSVTGSYSITLVKGVRNHLQAKPGDVIGFYLREEKELVLTKSQFTQINKTLDLLGSATITTTFTVTIPKKIRKILHINKGDVIGFHIDTDSSIMIVI